MSLAHVITSVVAAIVAAVGAFFWYKSAVVSVLSNDTQGWGALLEGAVVVKGPNGERIELVETTRLQSIWNKRAAIASAIAVLLGAAANFVP